MATDPHPQSSSESDRADAATPRPTWSTTASSELDETVAANDEAALGVHASACKMASDWRLLLAHTFDKAHALTQPRLITVMVLVLVAAAAAALLFA